MKMILEIDGKSQTVQAQKISGKLWVHSGGRTFVVETESKKSSRGGKSSAIDASQLLAPMPGKITKLFHKVGESVKKGEPVLVMEAMKMEYTLKAQSEVTITKVYCQVGDQVVLGKILVEFELKEKSK
jgi:acetyl/propionyl-CoA carboxylase alpha subunit